MSLDNCTPNLPSYNPPTHSIYFQTMDSFKSVFLKKRVIAMNILEEKSYSYEYS